MTSSRTADTVVTRADVSSRRFWVLPPVALLVAAVVAALLHAMPVWHAAQETPQGWRFTGNTRVSPDYMQYRVWSRLSQDTGILVDNTFTSEPNKPHLPVLFYWVVGKVARATGQNAEIVVTWFGSAFAFLFWILVFLVVRWFLPVPYQAWWVFAAIVVGGGLGTHLRFLTGLGFVEHNFALKRLIVDGVRSDLTWEDLRGPYPVISLFDAHYLFVWILTTSCVMSLYHALRRPGVLRTTVVFVLFGVTTVLHVYEGITLAMIAAGAVFMLWRKGLGTSTTLRVVAAAYVAIALSYVVLLTLYHRGGLPVTSWRAPIVLLSALLIAHPIQWLIMSTRLREYWQRAGFDECFLLGWMLGCVVLTLSGPYYPYTDRGTMTLAIPVCIVAGAMFFHLRPRLSAAHVAIVLATLGVTGPWMVKNRWETTAFTESKPFVWLSADHERVLDVLRANASRGDLLVASERELLWIAPDYPGRLYCAHFFLTVDYDRKQKKLLEFFDAGPAEQAAFLAHEGVRFVFVEPKQRPDRFRDVPGLRPVIDTPVGALFEYAGQPATADATLSRAGVVR